MLCVFKRRGYSEGESRWGGVMERGGGGLGLLSSHGRLSAGTGRYTGGLTFDGQMTAGRGEGRSVQSKAPPL